MTLSPALSDPPNPPMIDRLSPTDLIFWRLETTDWPCHVGGLALAGGGMLLDDAGRIRLDAILSRLERRMDRAPKLRRRVHRAGPFLGRPLWVDDQRFDLRAHVRVGVVAAPGTEREFFAAATAAYDLPLDRRRPLWELWFLTGRADGRVGILVKLHHSLADGLAAMSMLTALLDDAPAADGAPPLAWAPRPPPSARELFADNLALRTSQARATALALTRRQALRTVVERLAIARHAVSDQAAGAFALNSVVRAGRSVRVIRLDLAQMRTVAHGHGGTVHGVVLALWTAGLTAVLQARGEPVDGVDLLVATPVSLTGAGSHRSIANHVGSMMLRLPAGRAPAPHRLAEVVARLREAKATQRPASIMGFLATLAATPLGRAYSARQRGLNALATNVAGPTTPVTFLGADVLEITPIIELVGNVGLTLCAFSYCGRMSLTVTADTAGFPDLDVLMAGMAAQARALGMAAQ